MTDIPAWILALLFFTNCLLLLQRWREMKNDMIIASGILPRLTAGIAYLYFALGEVGLVEVVPIILRGSLVRGLWAMLLLAELLNHAVLWRKGKRLDS